MKKNSDTPKNAAALSCPDSSHYSHQPTKLERVLTYLITHGSITPAEAHQHCQCWRLAAVVHTLKKAGIVIQTRQEAHEGGYHARYWLPAESTARASEHLNRLQQKGGSHAVV